MSSSSYKVIGSISEGLKKGKFDWVINICSDNTILKTFDPVISPTFSFASSSWYMKMNPYTSDEVYISVYLYREDSEVPNYVTFSFKMIFLGMEVKRESSPIYFKTVKSQGWKEFLPRKHLLDRWTKTLDYCCQLIVRIRIRDHTTPRYEDTSLQVRLKGNKILSQNYKDLLLAGDYHDLVLKVKHKEFKVHRNIMQSRCPVFKSMLEHEMLEKNSGVVDIPDCDPSAFEQFLLYIYTGDLVEVLDKSTMLDLYFIADKYNVEYLREECCAFIKKSLSAHVVCDVIKLALDHSDSALLEFATKYFVNNAKEIFVTVEWMSFNKAYPIQANELMIKAFDKCSHCCVRRSGDGASDLEKK